MLVYEKNNKLNINFENEVSENPDLQIGKEDGKTQVLIDGQPGGGGSVGGTLDIEYFSDAETGDLVCNKTNSEIIAAIEDGKSIHAEFPDVEDYGTTRMYMFNNDLDVVYLAFFVPSINGGKVDLLVCSHYSTYVIKHKYTLTSAD